MKEIQLTRGKVALVDDIDYEWLCQRKWHAGTTGYATSTKYTPGNPVRSKRYSVLWMHREIMRAKPGQFVDHKNGNRLDNRRKNLRFCTKSQNSQNHIPRKGKSIYTGVSWNPYRRTWVARIVKSGKPLFIGAFKKERQAALAYDLWARDCYGEFARPNFECIAYE